VLALLQIWITKIVFTFYRALNAVSPARAKCARLSLSVPRVIFVAVASASQPQLPLLLLLLLPGSASHFPLCPAAPLAARHRCHISPPQIPAGRLETLREPHFLDRALNQHAHAVQVRYI